MHGGSKSCQASGQPHELTVGLDLLLVFSISAGMLPFSDVTVNFLSSVGEC